MATSYSSLTGRDLPSGIESVSQTQSTTPTTGSSYTAQTGRELPTGIVSVMQNAPGTFVQGTGDGGSTPYTKKTTTRKTPKKNSKGVIIGYTVDVIDEDGIVISSTFQALTAADENPNAADDMANRDAFAIIKGVFNQYGLEELALTIETLMREGYGPEEAALALKTNPEYNAPYLKRFKGNELRRAAGLNVLSEAEYLALEDDYTKTLKSYGLENYFGIDKSVKQSSIADVIGADISAIEFTDRVSTAVDRVKMADQSTKDAFKNFYGINESELVQYFLDPKKALVNLKQKATAAEIGGAAIGQGLSATSTTAEDLAAYGINREQAQLGYSQISEDLPTAGSLGRVYGESGITYNQADAEAATFKGLASAKRKKEKLTQLEQNQFSGSSGTGLGAGAFSTQYLRKSSSSGQF